MRKRSKIEDLTLLSCLAASADTSYGKPSKHLVIDGGHAVFGPTPLVTNNFFIKLIDSSLYVF